MRKKLIFSALIVGGLLSCTKKPMHPVNLVPSQFPSSTKAYKPIEHIAYRAWWRQFHDQELNLLIDLGLKNNNDIHIALANLQQAQGALQQVKLSWIPIIKTYAGYSTNPALGAPAGFYGVWPYYAINIMQLYSQQKQAKYYVDYAQAAISGARLLVIGQISAAYFTLMAQHEQLRLIKQLDKDLKQLIVLSEQDIRIGLATQIDLAQLQADERQVAAQIHPVQHNIVVSENALRYLINADPGAVRSKNNFAQLDFSRFKPGSVPVEVLNNRPDMKMAEYALKAAKMDINIAYSNFFPALQLDDFIGEAHLPNSKFVQASDAYFNGSVALSTLGTISTAKGGYQAKIAEFIKTAKRILKEVDTDYSANKQMNQQYLTYLHAEKDYRHKYKLQQGLLKTGLISYKELVQSKIYLDNLALSTNQAKLELAMSLVILYQDLAGGYAYTQGSTL
ncbi:TolC family protein [Legionella sp. km772]|uniref:TolC family protein n=1 Tax=Legionella sp. km772 TaxID=2498111 RepID=UPI000F8E8E6A|nr:TolC family protein [Legionella sp. km772]RUR09717.1 TolC family protein [Legionella sp. km772]